MTATTQKPTAPPAAPAAAIEPPVLTASPDPIAGTSDGELEAQDPAKAIAATAAALAPGASSTNTNSKLSPVAEMALAGSTTKTGGADGRSKDAYNNAPASSSSSGAHSRPAEAAENASVSKSADSNAPPSDGKSAMMGDYPTPSGGLLPPPPADEDASGQNNNMPPPPTSRQKNSDLPSSDTRVNAAPAEGGSASAVPASAKSSADPSAASNKRASSASVAGAAPARPSPIPPSSETAERIASAASSRRGSAFIPGEGEYGGSSGSPALRPLSGSRGSSSTRGSKRISGLSISSRSGGAGDVDESNAEGGGTAMGAITPTNQSINRLSVSTLSQQTGSSSRRTSRSPAGPGSASGSSSAAVKSKHLSTASSRSGGAPLSPTSEQPSSSTAVDPRRASTASGSVAGGSNTDRTSGTPQRRRVTRGASYLSTATSARTSLLIAPEARSIKIRDFGFPVEDTRHFGLRENDEEEEEELEDEGVEEDQGSWQGGAGNDDDSNEPATVASPEEDDYESWHTHQEPGGMVEGEEGEAEVGLPHGWYTAMYGFDAESAHELTVVPGERLLVVGGLPGGWAIVVREAAEGQEQVPSEGQEGQEDGAGPQRGLVPEAYLAWAGEA
ncbi:hypothetical protein A4X09_0g6307 [Tilletia walkeri]|uniref:SH3 domain-containing protein n=1 Tax=Tilletia walkeri TaxID=117179 RepID=A0A8X7N5I0_9BASI|nr:hypothetical protein A4X09_0g6307 [Tilletia walkeri]